jgi:hypothetical protein
MPQVLNIHPNYNIQQVPNKCPKKKAPSVQYSTKQKYSTSAQEAPKK